MPRDLPTGVKPLIEESTTTQAHLLELQFSDGSQVDQIYLTTASQDLTTSGLASIPDETWTGIGFAGGGSLLGIGAVEETGDLRAQSVDLSLNGVDQSIIAILGTNFFRGHPARIWRVWLDDETGEVISGVLLFSGLQLDNYVVNEEFDAASDESRMCSVETTLASRVARLGYQNSVMTNITSHNAMLARAGLSTGDTGFQNVKSIENRKIHWGQEGPSPRRPAVRRTD